MCTQNIKRHEYDKYVMNAGGNLNANTFFDRTYYYELEEGDYSGQEFRQNVLHPALKKAIEMNVKLIVDLDGTAGLGTDVYKRQM